MGTPTIAAIDFHPGYHRDYEGSYLMVIAQKPNGERVRQAVYSPTVPTEMAVNLELLAELLRDLDDPRWIVGDDWLQGREVAPGPHAKRIEQPTKSRIFDPETDQSFSGGGF